MEGAGGLSGGADPGFKAVYKVVEGGEDSPELAFRKELRSFSRDERYECRHPLYARYFRNSGHRSGKRITCPGTVPFKLSNGLDAGSLIRLDPERVHAVHLLFAGQGDAMMSRFGHVAFRLIVCPENESSDQACNGNLYDHLVVGYVAHVDAFRLSPMKGLFGGYRAHLVATRFMDAYEQYAIREFREIHSLPLEMDRKEVQEFVRALAEVHWSYTGKYRFVTNNCSTMAQRFLTAVWRVNDKENELERLRWRPDRFFSALSESGLASTEVLEDKKEAEKGGFYFPSTRPAYEQASELVFRARRNARFESLDEYLNQMPDVRLSKIVDDESYFRSLRESPRLLSAQIMLEELSFLRAEDDFQAELANWFDENDMDNVRATMRDHLDAENYAVAASCLLDPIRDYLRPVKRYEGIPANGAVFKEAGICRGGGMQAVIADVRRLFISIDPSWHRVETARRHWEKSIRNIEFLTDIEAEIGSGPVATKNKRTAG